uniref:basic salivary proline-rich protein 2-like n=1 Tax=Nyctereutes procyonoides TaxID=34880 RepID=UPI002444DE92|nr:basic salivary proline-rich protein 2-like [Nyctereutes procyonoides]
MHEPRGPSPPEPARARSALPPPSPLPPIPPPGGPAPRRYWAGPEPPGARGAAPGGARLSAEPGPAVPASTADRGRDPGPGACARAVRACGRKLRRGRRGAEGARAGGAGRARPGARGRGPGRPERRTEPTARPAAGTQKWRRNLARAGSGKGTAIASPPPPPRPPRHPRGWWEDWNVPDALQRAWSPAGTRAGGWEQRGCARDPEKTSHPPTDWIQDGGGDPQPLDVAWRDSCGEEAAALALGAAQFLLPPSPLPPAAACEGHHTQHQKWSFKLNLEKSATRWDSHWLTMSLNSSFYPKKSQIWLHQLFNLLLFSRLICHGDRSPGYTSSTRIPLSLRCPDSSEATFHAWSEKVNPFWSQEEERSSQTTVGWREGPGHKFCSPQALTQ